MRKAILFLLAVFCLCMANKTMAYSFSAVNNGKTIYYNITSSSSPRKVEVTYATTNYNSYSGAVAIPSSVTYNSNTYSVTTIGNYAFKNCYGLTSITIGNSVTTIGEYGAFESCSGLTSISIPNSVTDIGNYTFANCSGLTSVSIPNSVTTIRFGTFYGCSGLTSITIPNSVTDIKSEAFKDCYSLTSVSIPNSVTDIGDVVFSGCYGLTFVSIGNSVTNIGNNAFGDCIGLTSISIPNSVTDIYPAAFIGCIGLTSISVDANNTAYSSNAGILFNKAQTTLICFPGGKTGSYTIPNSVTAIEDFAFAVCIGLTSISIPSSVTTIGDGVFGDCIGLTSIFVDANNTAYSSNAGVLFNKVQTTLICFSGGKTGSYTIPNTVTAIEDLAFSGCIGLTSVTIPNSVTSIGEEAFSGCIGLTSVTISNSVTDIGDYTFSGCIGLTEIYVKAVTPPSISSTTFYDVSTTIAIHVPCGKKTAYQSAAYWSDFTNIIEDILFTVTVQSNDATMGNVNITQHNTCTNNTEIIAATPNNGYRFVQWNDGNTQNPRTITVRQDTSFTAIFAIEGMFYVGVMSNNTTMGTVSGSGDYAENTTVTISATPNSGYRFVQWNDGNTQNPRTITVRQDTSFIAIFVEDIPVYHVTVTTNDSEKGTVSGEGDYSLNTSIIIKATPKAGYRFVHWNDGNTVASRTITVTQDTNFMAIFAISDPNKYHVTVLANKENMGTVAGDGDYERNTTISIVAFPNQGYRFAHWNDGNVENPRTVTVVMRDLLFIAIFEAGVSITDIEEAPAINVYPNPARDNIHITLPENVSQAVFALYDIQGKVLIRKEIVSQETLSVSNLAGGIYIYHVITDKKTHTGKLKIKN